MDIDSQFTLNSLTSQGVLSTKNIIFENLQDVGDILQVTAFDGLELRKKSIFLYSFIEGEPINNIPSYYYERQEEPFDGLEYLESSTNIKLNSFSASYNFSMFEISDHSDKYFLSIYFNDERMMVL